MSKIAEKMRAATSKPAAVPALLVLEDGAVFAGTSCGAPGEAFGEICFNTSLESYLEIVTDPSYAGQIVALTYPQVGNYGVNADDAQAERPALRALVVRDLCPTPSSWRSQESLGDYLTREGVVAIEGIDTRALVRHIRDHGAQRAVVSTTDADVASLLEKVRRSPSLVGVNLAADVSCDGAYSYTAANLPASHGFALAAPAEPRFKVVVYHCGVKRSILDGLVASGCRAHRRALGHSGRRGAGDGPRRRVPLQRPGRPGGGGGDLSPGREAAGQACRCSASAWGTR